MCALPFTQELFKSIEVTDSPLRCCKWIPSKNWIVVGADDAFIRIYNLHTGELVKKWEAHADYVRSLAVHPSKLQLLSSSDDFTIKVNSLLFSFITLRFCFPSLVMGWRTRLGLRLHV